MWIYGKVEHSSINSQTLDIVNENTIRTRACPSHILVLVFFIADNSYKEYLTTSQIHCFGKSPQCEKKKTQPDIANLHKEDKKWGIKR